MWQTWSVAPVIYTPQLYPHSRLKAAETRTPGRRSQPVSALCSHRPLFSYLTWSEKIFWLSQPKGPWAEVIRSHSRSVSFRNKHLQTWDGSMWRCLPWACRRPGALWSETFSKTAVRFDFCREDELKRLGVDRRRGQWVHVTSGAPLRGIFVTDLKFTNR